MVLNNMVFTWLVVSFDDVEFNRFKKFLDVGVFPVESRIGDEATISWHSN